MKRIGMSDDGSILLECSRREYNALQHLEETAKGCTLSYSMSPERKAEQQLLGEFTAYFEAVWQWIELKNGANDLRHLLDKIDAVLKSSVKTNDEP